MTPSPRPFGRLRAGSAVTPLPRQGRGAGGEGVLRTILSRLDGAYDFSGWHWQAHTPPEYVAITAVLVQHTNWRNVEQAIERLRDASAFSLDAIAALPEDRLAELVRPAGTPAVKAKRLRALAQLAGDAGGLDALLALPADELRARLLATHGIGPETADAILLNAAGRAVFQIDAYTVRIMRRLGLGPERPSRGKDYDAWQRWFEEHTPSPPTSFDKLRTGSLPRRGRGVAGGRGEGADAELYRRYHGLFVLHGKQTCRPRPRCGSCCLLDLCPTGQRLAREVPA